MPSWSEEELDFLREKLQKPTADIYAEWNKTRGDTRTYDSVQKKVHALRAEEALEDDDSDGEDSPEDLEPLILNKTGDPTTILPPGLKAEMKAANKVWITEYLEAAKHYKLNLPSPAAVSD